MLKGLLLAGAVALVLSGTEAATAQGYPSRTVNLIVPFPAGGPLDTLARILAERMRVPLGHPLVVENVPGASGNIGTGRVARAAADGYTVGFGSLSTHVANAAVSKLQYDVRSDFEPIALLVSQPLMVVGKKALQPNDLRELITWLKANPDKATQGTSGPAAMPHLAGLLLQSISGARFRFVPYRGGGLAMQDLVSGQIDMMIDLAPNSLPQVQAGNIKAYAVTAAARLAGAPNVPTTVEAGLPEFQVSVWQALYAPKGTPRDIIAKLNGAVVEALADRAIRERIEGIGQIIFPRDQQTPEALAALQKAEVDKWWPIIKAANLKAE